MKINGFKVLKRLTLSLSLITIIFTQNETNEDYNINARIVLSISHNKQYFQFNDQQIRTNKIESIGFSQSLSGLIYLSELNKELKNKLIKKAPKKMQKSIKKLNSISVGAQTFSSIYSIIPSSINYTSNNEYDFLFLNWPYIDLELYILGLDLSLSSIYLYNKNEYNQGKTMLRPSLGVSLGLSDISISKKFPFSFNIHYRLRYFTTMEFDKHIKINRINTEPSITINLKIPYEVKVPFNKI